MFLVITNVIILLMFGGGIYYFLNAYSYVDFYKRLETRAGIAARYNLDQDELTADAYKKIREQHLEKLSEEKEYIIELNPQLTVGGISEESKLPAELLQEIIDKGKSTYKNGNTFYAGQTYPQGKANYIVVVSAENYYSSHHLSFLRNILIIGLLLTLLVTSFTAYYFSRYIFEPIRQITQKVKTISAENFHLRLEEEENNHEIKELKFTFNDLLNRLETAFETQKNFISNASHELGTPLTSIIGEADVSLIKSREPEEYQESLKSILKQAERLDEIIKSLIFLAQTGYEGKRIPFETIRVDDILWAVKTVIDKLNPDNKIHFDFSLLPDDPRKLKIQGNRQLLHIAFANLLNNACKYSYNKPVTVSIGSSNSQVVIIIRDNGVGIPEDEIPFIYDPFFRASNTKYFEGYGIGLPLTRNILRLHQGTIQVASVINSGTTVQVTIPLSFPK